MDEATLAELQRLCGGELNGTDLFPQKRRRRLDDLAERLERVEGNTSRS